MMMPKRAFSLVELLVVIAVISILAGLLLPALEDALESARGMSCINNLRQLNVAVNSYTFLNDEFIPYSYTRGMTEPDGYPAYYMMVKNGDLDASFQSMFGKTYWVSSLLQCPSALSLEPTWPGNVAPENFAIVVSRNGLSGKVAVNYPASPRGSTSANSNSGEVRRTIFHYGVNALNAGEGPFTCDLIWPDTFCQMSRISRVRKPSDCWVAGDSYEAGLNKNVYRHNERSAFSCFDGSAALIPVDGIDYVYYGSDFRVSDSRQKLDP